MTDITPIIMTILTLLGALITTILIPYIRSRTTAEQQAAINSWVGIAVYAAEQIIGSGKGAEKKQYVLDFLAGKGLTYDATAVDAMIEAAVKQLNIEQGK